MIHVHAKRKMGKSILSNQILIFVIIKGGKLLTINTTVLDKRQSTRTPNRRTYSPIERQTEEIPQAPTSSVVLRLAC